MDSTVHSDPLRRRLRRLGRWERCEEAAAFVDLFHTELEQPDCVRRSRKRVVIRDMLRHGFYEHTPEELAYGARVAWRNHARCIGRLFWNSLEVVDCRSIQCPDLVAGRAIEHLREAAGSGKIRSIISIFPPARGSSRREPLPTYIESQQLIQYAGYAIPGKGYLGDQRNLEWTRTARAMGWKPPPTAGAFDLLPIMIRDAQGRRLLYELPSGTVSEVEIEHPACADLATLGLKWYTVPCVSSMILTIGGIDYPCAPFNGYYMVTEIASRNLGDSLRYNMLPRVAQCLGLDPVTSSDPMWRDRALTELNAAVLYSFARDGVMMVDHHLASEQYMRFVQREQSSGRTPSGDWSWIVPPEASASTEVFHLLMKDRALVPNYYKSRAIDGGDLALNYDDEYRSWPRWHWDRLRSRLQRRLRNSI